jgi:hypothetical protein
MVNSNTIKQKVIKHKRKWRIMLHIFLVLALNEDTSLSACFTMGVTIPDTPKIESWIIPSQRRQLLAGHRTLNCDYKMCFFM